MVDKILRKNGEDMVFDAGVTAVADGYGGDCVRLEDPETPLGDWGPCAPGISAVVEEFYFSSEELTCRKTQQPSGTQCEAQWSCTACHFREALKASVRMAFEEKESGATTLRLSG